MPTNLPPEYFKAEARYKSAKTTAEKIELLEQLISTIPKHKGTDKLRADLRRRLSRLRDSAQAQKSAGGHESLYHVEREGVARVVLLGPPNTGKSSLLAALSHAEPKVANSPYTTWAPMPGMMEYKNVQIQLIDTPPMSKEHVEPELLDLVRTSDLIVAVIDLKKDCLAQCEEIRDILNEHKIIPVRMKDSVKPEIHESALPFLIAVNKADDETFEEDISIFCALLEAEWPIIGVSAKTGRKLEYFREMVFKQLQLIRVFSRPPGKEPDFNAPYALQEGSTVDEFAAKVHRDFVENLKSARVWGKGVYDGQQVGRDHILHDGDVVELHI
jgi:small GTP-binding protein